MSMLARKTKNSVPLRLASTLKHQRDQPSHRSATKRRLVSREESQPAKSPNQRISCPPRHPKHRSDAGAQETAHRTLLSLHLTQQTPMMGQSSQTLGLPQIRPPPRRNPRRRNTRLRCPPRNPRPPIATMSALSTSGLTAKSSRR